MNYRKEAEKILLNRFNERYPHIIEILALFLEGERVCTISEMFPEVKEQSIRNTKQRYKQDIQKTLKDSDG